MPDGNCHQEQGSLINHNTAVGEIQRRFAYHIGILPAGGGTFLFRQESTQRMRHKGRYEPIAPPYVSPAAPLLLPQATRGFPKGEMQEILVIELACVFSPLVVGRVRETYETFPGGSLHTFSPERKYDRPPAFVSGDCHRRQAARSNDNKIIRKKSVSHLRYALLFVR